LTSEQVFEERPAAHDATATATTKRGRLPSLTGLRFIAAFTVFIYHITQQRIFGSPGANQALVDVFGRAGGVGVSFFFILSGFVLTWSARPADRPVSVWRRRAAKVFPNHVVTWALIILIMLSIGDPLTLKQSVLNLFLVQSWVPDPNIFFSVNRLAWSLSCEVLFYLLFPLLLPAVRRIRDGLLWPTAITLMAAIWCVPLVAKLLGGPPKLIEMGTAVPVQQWWLVYVAPPARFLEFVLGMVMCLIVLSGRWIGLGRPLAVALTMVGYVVATRLPYLFSIVAATAIPLALLIPAMAVADEKGHRPLGGRVMIYLGDVSYAFYLVGGMATFYLLRAFGKGMGLPQEIGFMLLCFAVTLFIAATLHRVVERPMMRRLAGSRR
jgi:peptidoglycan/LPS O-acetylase OafA/YrhL